MAIRITQGMIYGNYVNQMQTSLGAYMNSAEQGSTQKKVNTPSDDPAATYNILNLRNTQSYNEQLRANCDTAKGWLKLEDSVLSTQLPTVITSIKELAEQASTGTYTAEQRQQIAYQVRQQFGSLLNLANTEFDGKSLFAGHKYDQPAFQEGLSLLSKDESWNNQIALGNYVIEGNSDSTIAFQMLPDSSATFKNLASDTALKYRWTKDGGENWHEGVVSTDSTSTYYIMDFDGVTVKVSTDAAEKITLSQVDESKEGVSSDQHTVYIHPTAIYQGDVNDEIKITTMGFKGVAIDINAQGTFSGNTLVRFDDEVTFPASSTTSSDSSTVTSFKWSYSTDNGMNWVQTKGSIPTSGTSLRLPLPEGYLDLTIPSDDSDSSSTAASSVTIPADAQVMIHPEDANLEYEIMKGTYITVNGVGKEIFGGVYDGKPVFHGRTPEWDKTEKCLKTDGTSDAFVDPNNNLFEIVGNFIAYLETNNQNGCQETLVGLTKAEEHILTQSTKVGGLENRVDVAYDVLTSQKLDISERLSYIEDIDLTELLVKMQQQQITYQTVLQSASRILNLSLANYL
ncbi:MAG: flagellar hook-associated protein FlgL [Desulfovibrionaceae bacterium]|nr:flagellar hook-associated protein FlgL [Desulfovibrionaceae bacterium]